MRHLFEYLESTLNYGSVWRLHHSNLSDMMMKVFVDADHGVCLDTARSTSGWNVYLSSPDGSTHALIDWASRRQQSTAKSWRNRLARPRRSLVQNVCKASCPFWMW